MTRPNLISDTEKVKVEAFDSVLIITLNRPEKRNAIDAEMAASLDRSFDFLDGQSEYVVGILASEGRVFCSGADLRAHARGERETLWIGTSGFAGLTSRKRTKPLIAAVEGPALAGGFELALACDLIVAGRTASFGLPEVRRCLVAAGGGLVRLPQMIPPLIAMEMLLTGDPITAERAYELGLLNKLVEEGSARAVALELAERISENAPIAVRESRRVALMAAGHADESAIWVAAREAREATGASIDANEGVAAFLEKRRPVWRDRGELSEALQQGQGVSREERYRDP